MKKLTVAVVFLTAIFGAAWASGSGDKSGSAGGALPIKMTVRLFDQVPDMNNAYWKAYQEKAGVKLDVEWIPDGDYKTKLNLILSSNDIREVLVANNSNDLNNPAFINAVQNGAFWELTDILGDFSKYPNLKTKVAPDAYKTTRILGKIYGIPQSVPKVQSAPIIRQDLVEKAGMKMPATMTELLDVLEAIVKQNPRMIGLVSKQDMFLQSNGGLANAFGVAKPSFNEEGGLIYPNLKPEFTKFVAFLRDAYSRGILSREFSVMKPTQATEYFQSGAAAMMINESARWCYPFTQTLREKIDPNAVAQITPPLQGDPGSYAIAAGTGVVDQLFISRKVPREKVLQILDYFERTTTDAYYDLTTWGVEGIHYTRDAKGYKVVTSQRDKDLGSSAPWQVLPLMYNPYMKLDSTSAPEEYNIAQRKLFFDYGYDAKGIPDPFSIITSSTWIQVWPRHQQAWAAKAVQAVVGDISLEDFQTYVDGLNRDPDIRKAYREFAEAYKAIYN
ncbi:MAG: extracellular solute-binding protein [Spirochaetaceae bacterium]|jgi:putative aldouronate transport system substrate-binding protein|nr:extracellular solute-binding protein [Spirochaetaceae bacterium]